MKNLDSVIKAATQIVAADIKERAILEDETADWKYRLHEQRKNAVRMADARHNLCKAVTGSKDLMCSDCGKYPRDWPGALCVGCATYQEHTAI